MIIDSMQGLGDNIYQRAFISQAKEPVYLNTPWPEIYEGLPHVRFMPRQTTLRTQRKNLERVPRDYGPQPAGRPYGVRRRNRYSREGVFAGMASAMGLRSGPMNLPSYGQNPHAGETYAVIRPCTVRAEWRAESRNCLPHYINEAAYQLHAAGIKVISVADLEDRQEWLVGGEPLADVYYHKGELNIYQLLSLIEGATLVVGPVGWIVPACLAYEQDALIICGGNGGYNHPSHLTDPEREVCSVRFATPEPMCMCTERRHACQKEIPDFNNKFAAYLAARIGDGLQPRTPNRLRRLVLADV